MTFARPTLNPPVDQQRDHILGPRNAPVTLVEYGDYECPYCGAAHATVVQIVRSFGDKVRFVFRHFPLSRVHPHAQKASEAAEAAGAQGQFWPMHRLLYENQRALDMPHLLAYADALNLNVERFAQELASGVHAARVREDFMSGVRSGVNGTPTFFINGRRHDGGYDPQTLLAAIAATAAPTPILPGGR